MARNKRYHNPERETIDPYAGEKAPAVKGADRMKQIVPADPGDHRGAGYLLEEEESIDALVAD